MGAVHRFDEVTSTNDVARELAERGAVEGTVVLARRQTAGRGRRGRTWFSPAAGNVYLSYVHPTRVAPARVAGATLDAAVAVATAVEDLVGLRPELKWPNDLLLGGRKVAGILTELVTDAGGVPGAAALVVGVGVNANLAEADLPEELRGVATSLAAEAGGPVDEEALAALVARRLGEKLAGFEAAGRPDLAAWRARFHLAGRAVRLAGPGGDEVVTVEGVDEDGALRVRDGSGAVRALHGGEITLAPADARGEGP